jgi:V8-like Glu-specific endopeptidase
MKYTFLSLALALSFSVNATTSSPYVIYGEDNRMDTFETTSPLYRKLAESTAAMIDVRSIAVRGNTAELHGEALSQWTPQGMSAPVCKKERFSHQPLASVCSGFLVADNIIATAGHCMTSFNDCMNYKWVFNYKVSDRNQTAVSVDVKDVYNCSRIIKQGLANNVDFALIQLDRPLTGKALKIAKSEPTIGTSLVMIGHPSGLPQKISDNAKIVALRPNGFATDLDAFQGNSGSAVFNASNGELIGILVNGNVDYRHNSTLNCTEVNVMNPTNAGEGVSSFRQFLSFL